VRALDEHGARLARFAALHAEVHEADAQIQVPIRVLHLQCARDAGISRLDWTA
jgi:hypothetical protein